MLLCEYYEGNNFVMLKMLKYILTTKEKVYILYLLILVIIGSIAELLGVSVFMPFIGIITDTNKIFENYWMNLIFYSLRFESTSNFLAACAGAIIAIYVFKNLFLIYEKNTVYKFTYNLQHRLAKKMMYSYMYAPYTFHLSKNVAELTRALQIDTDNFAKAIIHFIELIMELFVAVALGVYLFIVSPIITLITLGVVSLVAIGYVLVTKELLKSLGRKNQINNSNIIKYVNQSMGGIKEIKVLGREDYFITLFSDIFKDNGRCMRIIRLSAVLPKYFIEAASMTGLLTAVIVEIYLGQDNLSVFIPKLAVFATAAFRLMPTVGRVNEHVSALHSNAPSIDLIYEDLKEVEHTSKQNNLIDPTWKLEKSLIIKDICYRYPDADRNVINNLSMTIQKGQTIALIGGSGAGKTTLADVILGVLTPQKGTITADDMDVFDNCRTWEKEIGYIPQMIYLSDDTIVNNIAFGVASDEIDMGKVVEASQKAQIYSFIQSLPDGFETIVGDRGARLSGGQRQRIGIARALYHDPEVIVLDEATSALDNETESAVMEAIDSLHGKKTIVIIAHRLTTIKNADVVYEIKDGIAVQRDKNEVIKLSE